MLVLGGLKAALIPRETASGQNVLYGLPAGVLQIFASEKEFGWGLVVGGGGPSNMRKIGSECQRPAASVAGLEPARGSFLL